MEKKIRHAIFVFAVSALAAGPALADNVDRSAPAVRPHSAGSAANSSPRIVRMVIPCVAAAAASRFAW